MRSFCYVDKSCKTLSEERLFLSNYFADSGVDVYYSYSTCNSTEEDWKEELKSYGIETVAVEEIHLEAIVADYSALMYKRSTTSGEILKIPGKEYYDDG